MLLLSSTVARDQITSCRRLIPLPWTCTRASLSTFFRGVVVFLYSSPRRSPVYSWQSSAAIGGQLKLAGRENRLEWHGLKATYSLVVIVTGPPTHSVGGQYWFARWRLTSSSVVVCNTPIYNVTHQGAARNGGPVMLRPVRATPCFIRNYIIVAFLRIFCIEI